MKKFLSPGINIDEYYIPPKDTVQPFRNTFGAYIGTFPWGPINEPVLIRGKKELAEKFRLGSSDDDIRSYLGAYNFLSYGGGFLYVTRLKMDNATNAVGPLLESEYHRYIGKGDDDGLTDPDFNTEVINIGYKNPTENTVTISVDDNKNFEQDMLLFKNLNSNFYYQD